VTTAAIWPLFEVMVRTHRLTVQYADDQLLGEMAALAARGIHRADERPFRHSWSSQPPALLQRTALQHWWGLRSTWTRDCWTFIGAVRLDDVTVGLQALEAQQFARDRTVTTWSWLGLAYQSQGLGSQMRSAILHLAFDGLGAETATSAAFADNYASNAISRKLGYTHVRDELTDRDGTQVLERHWAMARSVWAERERSPMEITGLDAAIDLFR
jgi:RimJ/RimL family protein N-acetyltransferase